MEELIDVMSETVPAVDYSSQLDTLINRVDLLNTILLVVLAFGVGVFVCFLLYRAIDIFVNY